MLSFHNTNIEIGRHNTSDRRYRKCTKYDLNDIEHDSHFVLVCLGYFNSSIVMCVSVYDCVSFLSNTLLFCSKYEYSLT